MASLFKRYRNGVRVFVVAALVVVTVVVGTSVPYFLSRDRGSIESGLSQLNVLHDVHENPEAQVVEMQQRAPSPAPQASSLEDVLARASMADPFSKTVIITSLNAAWSSHPSMIDLFLESFRSGEGTAALLQHVVIVCVDQKAFERCVGMHSHCFRMTTPGVDFAGEKTFMSEDFVNMMWRRIQFLGEVLQLGYSFIFSDGDILWFRNPLPVFSETMDFQISTDRFRHRPFDLSSNWPNSGFLYARSNNLTAALYREWYEAGQRSSGKNDQQVLTELFRHRPDWVGKVGVKVQFFDTRYFSGFCQVSQDMSQVVTMHSNCCIGLSSKLHDLHLALEDWKAYQAEASNKGNNTHAQPWRVPSKCDFV